MRFPVHLEDVDSDTDLFLEDMARELIMRLRHDGDYVRRVDRLLRRRARAERRTLHDRFDGQAQRHVVPVPVVEPEPVVDQPEIVVLGPDDDPPSDASTILFGPEYHPDYPSVAEDDPRGPDISHVCVRCSMLVCDCTE
jgi:hypothetical protein